MISTLPNILTLSRIAVIPLLVALFYWDSPTARWIALGIFTVAAITDFFDGYFARSMDQHSRLGRMLDPIADKLLVGSIVIMLVAFQRAPVLAALVILCRELLVSGLREFLAEIRVSMPVSRLAQWKSFIQMPSIGFLLIADFRPFFLHPAGPTVSPAALLSLLTSPPTPIPLAQPHKPITDLSTHHP